MAETYPDIPFPDNDAAHALDGTTHPTTRVPFIVKDTDDTSDPKINVQENRNLQRLLNGLGRVLQGSVWAENTALNVGAFPLYYSIGGVAKYFEGATGVAVPDDDTSFAYLDTDQTLKVVTDAVGWPGDATSYIPLAEVVAASGAITSVKDLRFRGLNMVTDLGTLTATTSATIQLLSGASGPKLKAGSATEFQLRTAADDDYVSLVLGSLHATDADLSAELTVSGALDVTGAVSLSAALAVATANGIDINPGSDIDADLLTVGVTGAPRLWWDESEDVWSLTHGLNLAAAKKLYIGNEPLIVPVRYVITIPGALAVDAAGSVMKIFFDKGFTFKRAKGYVSTAPTGADLIVDVRWETTPGNGFTSLFTNQAEMLVIAAGTKYDTSAEKTTALAGGGVLDIEVEQVGSTIAGSDLTVEISGFCELQAAA